MLVGLVTILAIVKDLDDKKLQGYAFKENTKRKDLNTIEKINFVASLRAGGMEVLEIAQNLGLKERMIYRYVKIHGEINKIQEVAKLFDKHAADVDVRTAEDFADIADSLARLVKADRREFDRVLRKIERKGIKATVESLKRRFVDPGKGKASTESPAYFEETDKGYSLKIQVGKGDQLSEEVLKNIKSAIEKFLSSVEGMPERD